MITILTKILITAIRSESRDSDPEDVACRVINKDVVAIAHYIIISRTIIEHYHFCKRGQTILKFCRAKISRKI